MKSVWGGWREVKREVGFVRQLPFAEEERKTGGFTEELQSVEQKDEIFAEECEQRLNT